MTTVRARVGKWVDGLAGLLLARREGQRARKGLLISREDDHFVVRSMGRGREQLPQIIVPGATLPSRLARRARDGTVTFELKEVVVRRIQVPAPARDFLPGIVRNQIERLSPWRANETVYGFEGALNRDDPGTLDVCILMQSRAVIDAVRDQVDAIGLVVHRIVASDPPLVGPIALWSQLSQASEASLRRVRALLVAAIAGVLLLSLGVSAWALYSASSFGEQLDAVRTRERQLQAALTPQAVRALPPAQRAWVLKQTSPAAVLVLEALSRALPDQAYLTEFSLENGVIHITGFAGDAPALLVPLERSGFFSDVHFFAQTTRNADGAQFVFHIQARVEPHLDLTGE
jgi:general secretion pathway protein L